MTKLLLLAAAAISMANPALGAVGKAPAAPSVSPSSAPGASVAPRAQRYCVVDYTTGSRIARTTCQTRDAWLRDGFDPLAK